jgi:hypothetical protein
MAVSVQKWWNGREEDRIKAVTTSGNSTMVLILFLLTVNSDKQYHVHFGITNGLIEEKLDTRQTLDIRKVAA